MMTALGVTFKIGYILKFQERSYVVEKLLLMNPPNSLIYGAMVICIGLSCFILGYWRRKTPVHTHYFGVPRYQAWDGLRVRIFCVVLLTISTVAFLLFASSVGLGPGSLDNLSAKRFLNTDASGHFSHDSRFQSSSYIFYRIASLARLATFIMIVWILKQRKSWLSFDGLIIGWSGAQSVSLFFIMQTRASIVLLLLDGVILLYILARRLPVKTIVILGTVTVTLVVGQLSVRMENSHSVLGVVERSFAGRDLMDVSKSSHIINAVPDKLEYRNGETLAGWVAAPIPVSAWPNKPLWGEKGVLVCTRVFDKDNKLSSMTLGLIPELYWNFGIIGVCVGTYIAGVVLRHIYAAFVYNRDNPTIVLLYTVIVSRITIFTFGADLGTGILKTLLDVIPLIGILFLVGLVSRYRVGLCAQPAPALN